MVVQDNLESNSSIKEYEPGVFVMEAEVLYKKYEPLELELDDLNDKKD